MTYEFHEGLNKIRVEMAGDTVSVTQKSPDVSASVSFPIADLSPTPAFAKQRDGAFKSAFVLVGIVAFAAIIVVSMIRFSIGWSTFAIAVAVLVLAIFGAYFLTPTRRYAAFSRRSGVHAFTLKSRGAPADFDSAVAALTRQIAAVKHEPNQTADRMPRTAHKESGGQ